MGIISDAIQSEIKIVENPTYPALDKSKMEAFKRETANQRLEDVSPDVLTMGLAGMAKPFFTSGLAKSPEYAPKAVLPEQYRNDTLMQGLASIANMRH